MELTKFGNILRTIRNQKRLTQTELADGICSKGYVYMLEKGLRKPSAYVLNKLSLKLGEELTLLLSYSTYNDPLFVYTIYKKAKILRDTEKFKELIALIKEASNSEEFKRGKNQQFLLWHKAIIEYEINNQPYEAIELLKEALLIVVDNNKKDMVIENNIYSSQELFILNGIAKICYDTKEYDKANKYLDITINTVKMSCMISSDYCDLYCVSLYNKAKCLYIYDIEFAEELVDKALSVLIENNRMRLLGKILYMKGVISLKKADIDSAKSYIVKAIMILELEGKLEMVSFIKEVCSTKYGLQIE